MGGAAADVCMYRRSKKVGIAAAASQRRRRKRRSRTQNAKPKQERRKQAKAKAKAKAAQQRNPSSLIKKRHEKRRESETRNSYSELVESISRATPESIYYINIPMNVSVK